MRRGRFTEDQIIGVLREHEAGVKTAELCRKHGISDATFYNWKAKYGGMSTRSSATPARSSLIGLPSGSTTRSLTQVAKPLLLSDLAQRRLDARCQHRQRC